MKTTIPLVLILFVQMALAQNPSGEKRPIEKLAFKIGIWKWETEGLTTPGDPKMYKGTGYSNVYYVNDLASIVDEHSIEWENGIKYEAITYRTYDPTTEKYLVVWAQANSNNSADIEGHWENDKFVEINEGSDQYGNWTNKMEIYNILPDSHQAKLERKYESGYGLTILEYKATRVTK